MGCVMRVYAGQAGERVTNAREAFVYVFAVRRGGQDVSWTLYLESVRGQRVTYV